MDLIHVEVASAKVFGLAAIISAIVNATTPAPWVPVTVFAGLLAVLMTFDIVACYYTTDMRARPKFPWTEEVTGKLFLIGLCVVSLVLDTMVYVAVTYLQGTNIFPKSWVFDNGFLYITLLTEIWLIGAQVMLITTKVASKYGKENVPPHLHLFVRHVRSVFRTIRVIDEKRRDKTGKSTQQSDRWYDAGANEDDEAIAAAFIDFMAQQRAVEVSPQEPELPEPLDPQQENDNVGNDPQR